MNIEKLIRDANDYLEENDTYSVDTRRLGRMIDNIGEALAHLREDDPDSPQISELEECLNNLEALFGCAVAAEDMGLRDGDHGRDPDNNWF